MMDEVLYDKLTQVFSQYHIEEEAEDILLELAELISDKGILGQELCLKEKYGKTVVEACGICSADDEDEEELSVLIKWLKVGNQKFEIEDYFL